MRIREVWSWWFRDLCLVSYLAYLAWYIAVGYPEREHARRIESRSETEKEERALEAMSANAERLGSARQQVRELTEQVETLKAQLRAERASTPNPGGDN